MNRYITHLQANTGFSLIEALISLAVLSFGLLAIATFQGSLVLGSGYNKTRSEAMALAQQKLDDIRGYTTEEELVAKLKEQRTNGLITSTTGELFPEHAFADLIDAPLPTNVTMIACGAGFKTVPDANNPIEGTTQNFTRNWKYCLYDNELLYTVVEVSWTDMQGNPDMVAMHSAISWKNPSAAVLLTEIPEEPQVPSATGRAYLGDGKVGQGDIDDAIAKNDGSYEDNQDGTFSLYRAKGGADVALVDKDTNDIVLTLEDACKTQDPKDCFSFVKIKGRVYLDTNSSKQSLNTIYILASDAAYCARVFDTGGVPFNAPDTDGDNKTDYEYYDYTCYLGGGWYGNIGLLLTANSAGSNDRVCVGDPNAATTEGWKFMELAKRRVYRGLTYKRNPANYDQWITAGGFGPVDDEGLTSAETLLNTPLFYSKGIADGTEYPDFEKNADRAYVLDVNGNKIPQYPGRDGGHDYLVINAGGQADASNCVLPAMQPDSRAWDDVDGDGVMDDAVETFTDSNFNGVYDSGESYDDANSDGNYDAVDEVGDVGSLFANTPGDFICFNDEYYSGDGSDFDTTGTKPYLDGAEDPKFRNYPYLDRFNGGVGSTVDSNGTVIPADTTATVYGAEAGCRWDPSRPPPSVHLLSGSVINKTVSGAKDLQGSTVVSSAGDEDCWFVDGGGLKVTNPSGTTLDYVCRVYEWGDQNKPGDGWDGYITLTPAPSANVQCENLASYTTASLVHQYDEALLSNSVENDLATAYEDFICLNLAEVGISGTVSINAGNSLAGTKITATGVDGEVVDCTPASTAGTSFNYSCNVTEQTLNGGWSGTLNITPPNTTDYNCSPDSAIYTNRTTPINANPTCTGPIVTRTISGDISGALTLSGLQVDLLGAGGTCTITPGPANKSAHYDCDVVVDDRTDEWIGSILITPPSGVWCSNSSEDYTVVAADITRTASVCEVDTSDFVRVGGIIELWYNSDTQWYSDTVYGSPWGGTWDGIAPSPATDTMTTLAIQMLGSDGVTVVGTCTGPTLPLIGAPPGGPAYYTFSCSTDEVVAHNTTWSGSVRVSTGTPEPDWAHMCSWPAVDGEYTVLTPLGPGQEDTDAYFNIDSIDWCP